MPLLSIGPPLRDAIIEVKNAKGKVDEHVRQTVEEFEFASQIPLEVVEALLEQLRTLPDDSSAAGGGGSSRRNVFLHELLEGAMVTLPKPPPKKEKDPELVKRLAKLKAQVEEREYAGMVKSVTKVERAEQDRQEGVASLSGGGEGAALIVAMFTLFMIGFQIAKSVSEDKTVHYMFGLGGAIIALIMEGFLFVARSSRGITDIEKEKKKEEQRLLRLKARNVLAAENAAKAFGESNGQLTSDNKTHTE